MLTDYSDPDFEAALELFAQSLHPLTSTPPSSLFTFEDDPALSVTLDDAMDLVQDPDTQFSEVAVLATEFVQHAHHHPTRYAEARDMLHIGGTAQSPEFMFDTGVRAAIEMGVLDHFPQLWDESAVGAQHPWETIASAWFYHRVEYWRLIVKVLPVPSAIIWLKERQEQVQRDENDALLLTEALLERANITDAMSLWKAAHWTDNTTALKALAYSTSTLLLDKDNAVIALIVWSEGNGDVMRALPIALSNPNPIIGEVFLAAVALRMYEVTPLVDTLHASPTLRKTLHEWLSRQDEADLVLDFLGKRGYRITPAALSRLPPTPALRRYVRTYLQGQELALLLPMRSVIGRLGHWVDGCVQRMRLAQGLPHPSSSPLTFDVLELKLAARWVPHASDLLYNDLTPIQDLPLSSAVVLADFDLVNWFQGKGAGPRHYVLQVLEQALTRSLGTGNYLILENVHAELFHVTDTRYGWHDWSADRLAATAIQPETTRVHEFFPRQGATAQQHRVWSTPLTRFYRSCGLALGLDEASPATQAVVSVGYQMNRALSELNDLPPSHSRSFAFEEGPVRLEGRFLANTWKTARHIRLKHHLIALGNRDRNLPMAVFVDYLDVDSAQTTHPGDRPVSEYRVHLLQLLVDLGRVWARSVTLRKEAYAPCRAALAQWDTYAARIDQPHPRWVDNPREETLEWVPVLRARSVSINEGRALVVPEVEPKVDEWMVLPGADSEEDPRDARRPLAPTRYESVALDAFVPQDGRDEYRTYQNPLPAKTTLFHARVDPTMAHGPKSGPYDVFSKFYGLTLSHPCTVLLQYVHIKKSTGHTKLFEYETLRPLRLRAWGYNKYDELYLPDVTNASIAEDMTIVRGYNIDREYILRARILAHVVGNDSGGRRDRPKDQLPVGRDPEPPLSAAVPSGKVYAVAIGADRFDRDYQHMLQLREKGNKGQWRIHGMTLQAILCGADEHGRSGHLQRRAYYLYDPNAGPFVFKQPIIYRDEDPAVPRVHMPYLVGMLVVYLNTGADLAGTQAECVGCVWEKGYDARVLPLIEGLLVDLPLVSGGGAIAFPNNPDLPVQLPAFQESCRTRAVTIE